MDHRAEVPQPPMPQPVPQPTPLPEPTPEPVPQPPPPVPAPPPSPDQPPLPQAWVRSAFAAGAPGMLRAMVDDGSATLGPGIRARRASARSVEPILEGVCDGASARRVERPISADP